MVEGSPGVTDTYSIQLTRRAAAGETVTVTLMPSVLLSLTAATGTSQISSLTVAALRAPLTAGTVLRLVSGSTAQLVTLATAAQRDATTLSVTPFTPTINFVSGTTGQVHQATFAALNASQAGRINTTTNAITFNGRELERPVLREGLGGTTTGPPRTRCILVIGHIW